jgi:S1-C subfamily serine protease
MAMHVWIRALFLAGLGAGALALPARAEEWAVGAVTPTSRFEVDVSTLEVKQEVVKFWLRETAAKPRRDEQTTKLYTVNLSEWSNDCERRRFALGAFVRRDQQGQTVSTGSGGTGWQDIAPGSVAESVWRMVCSAARPPKDEPLLKAIGSGSWRSLGLSSDRKFTLSVRSDTVVQLDATHVGSYVRSDYAQPEWIDGFAVRYIVSASVVDCENEKTAGAGMDLYVSPSLRVKAVRVAQKDMQFEPLPPGSFLTNNIKDICGAAKPSKAKASAGEKQKDKENEISYYTGTAWGADKGYLVTAAHVIEDAKAIDVYRDGDKVGEAKVVVADFANDLAVLAFTKGPAAKLKTLPMALRGPALGRAVFTLGYPAPGLLGQQVKMTAGQVNSTAGLQDDTRMLQISIPVQGGNSGGPVMGWDGAVVGVVDSKINRLDEEDKERPENINYAVKASYLRPMLEDLPDLGNHEPVKFGPTQEKTVAAVREAVFMLLVAR